MNLQMLLCYLLLLSAAFQMSTAQSCPVVGCTGCGTTSIDCSVAGLTSFPQLPLDVQQTVERLELQGNLIGLLDEDVLENYTNLTTLRLDNNQLTELPEGLFAATTQLQVLNLFNNQLNELPEGLFAATTQLQELSLDGNQLTELPEGLFAATTQLQLLYLYSNQLTELPEGLFAATTQLQYLYLDRNELTELPEGLFAATTQLQDLFLYNNQLNELPEGLFAATTQLVRLYLDGNQLTELPVGLFAATTQLQDLYLSNNQLNELPEGLFAATTQLQYLRLHNNPLHCDCKLQWLPDFLNTLSVQTATCATPANLSDIAVVSLTEDQLVCESITLIPTTPEVPNMILFTFLQCQIEPADAMVEQGWRLPSGEFLTPANDTDPFEVSDIGTSQLANNVTVSVILLTIHPLSYQPAGVYSCEVRDTTTPGAEWVTAQVELQLRVDLDADSDTMVTVNDTASEVQLSCEMSNYIREDEDLQWFKEGQMISSGMDRHTVTYRDGKPGVAIKGDFIPGRVAVLTISDPEMEDSGTYTCAITGMDESIDFQLSVVPPVKILVTDSLHCRAIVWEPPDTEREISGYEVRIYYKFNGERASSSTMTYQINNKKTNWFAPDSLPAQRPLFFQVRAKLSDGKTSWSDENTLTNSSDCPPAECPTVTPLPIPVTRPGRIHQLQLVNNILMWSPPETTGGEITLYVVRVYYRRPPLQIKANLRFYNLERDWVILQELPTEIQLFIQVRAQNSAGDGPWSRELKVPSG